MKRLSAILLPCLLLAGCGSFPLGTSYPQQGQTQAQTDMNILVCKERAKNEANTDARVAGSFVAGLTIVGAPIAIAEERRKQREVFAECMTAKGYRVEPPGEGGSAGYRPAGPVGNQTPAPYVAPQVAQPVAPPAPQPVAAIATPAPAPAPAPVTTASSPAKDTAAQLQKLNDLRAKGLITEAEYNQKRKEILDSM